MPVSRSRKQKKGKAMFKANNEFKREYERIFKEDPIAANLFLLLAEMADKKGRVATTEAEIASLMEARFDDPRRYQL